MPIRIQIFYLAKVLLVSSVIIQSKNAFASVADEVDKVFAVNLSTQQIITIALKTEPNDNISNNTKNRAYTLLNDKIRNASDKTEIQKHFDDFEADWRKTKQDWIKTNIAALMLAAGATSTLKNSLSLNMLEGLDLSSADSARRKQNEQKAVDGLKNIDFDSVISSSEFFQKLTELMIQKFKFSSRVLNDVISSVDKVGAKLTKENRDIWLTTRFRLAIEFEDQKNRKLANTPTFHQVTIWDFASDKEVDDLMAHFDRSVCQTPPKIGIKNWSYSFVSRASNGGFASEVRNMRCGT